MTEAERRVRWYRARAIARAEAGGTSVGLYSVGIGDKITGVMQLAGMLRENATVTVMGLRPAQAARKKLERRRKREIPRESMGAIIIMHEPFSFHI